MHYVRLTTVLLRGRREDRTELHSVHQVGARGVEGRVRVRAIGTIQGRTQAPARRRHLATSPAIAPPDLRAPPALEETEARTASSEPPTADRCHLGHGSAACHDLEHAAGRRCAASRGPSCRTLTRRGAASSAACRTSPGTTLSPLLMQSGSRHTGHRARTRFRERRGVLKDM